MPKINGNLPKSKNPINFSCCILACVDGSLQLDKKNLTAAETAENNLIQKRVFPQDNKTK